MKRYFSWLLVAVIAVVSPVLHAQDYYDDYYEYGPDEGEPKREKAGISPEDDGTVFYALSYGAAASWLIRTINQKDAGNLVYRNFMPGLYVSGEMYNLKSKLDFSLLMDIIPFIRLAVYYPLDFCADTATINRTPQRAEHPWHVGADALIGIKLELLTFDYFRLNLCPALHMLFLSSDRWNYFNLGGGAVLGVEVPLSYGWTFLINGCISFDNGNLGGNRKEPFNSTYQYQVDIGFRYSKKKHNPQSLFGTRKPREGQGIIDEFDEYDDGFFGK